MKYLSRRTLSNIIPPLFFTLLFTLFFSPIIFSNRYLAPGDSFTQTVPSFNWNFELWNQYLYSGFPQFADPQAMMWYLPRILLMPISFNYFIVTAYILAGCFTYGYVKKITGNIYVSYFSGITFSMSGFFMAHLGHVNIIHTACWLPLILWGLEELKSKKKIIWIIIISFGVGNLILAGHPQIMFYSMILISFYLILLILIDGKFKIYFFFTAIFSIGIGILFSCIQLIPTIELSSQSVRSIMTFQMFNEYSLPLKQIFILFFPFVFGGIRESLYSNGYFGEWNLTEITGFMGWIPLIFSAIIIFSNQLLRDKRVLFWFLVSMFSFFLTLGETTFLSKIMFELPGFNMFRVPARHFFEYSFSVSILGGLGLKFFLDNKVKKRVIYQGIFLFSFLVGSLLLARSTSIIQLSKEKGIQNLIISPFENLSIGIPIIFLFLSVLAIYFVKSTNNKKYSLILLICILILELSSFGWFYEWRFDAHPTTAVNKLVIQNLNDNRIIVPESVSIPEVNLRPNISQLSYLRNIGGYNPLLLKKYKSLVGIETNGIIDRLNWNNQAFDILSGKYLFVSNSPKIITSNQIEFHKLPLNLHLNYNDKQTVNFKVNEFKADNIGIVMRLSNSIGLKDGQEVATVSFKYSDGSIDSNTIVVGKEVSEWAIDRPDVQKIIQHGRANVYQSFDMQDSNNKIFKGHNYLAAYSLDREKFVVSVEFNINNLSDVYLDLDTISLFDNSNKSSYQLSYEDYLLADKNRWSMIESNSKFEKYENLMVLPKIRSVSKLNVYSDDNLLTILKSSKLPDGNLMDFRTSSLLSVNPDFDINDLSINNTIKIIEDGNDRRLLTSNFSKPSFIVSSDVYYPGWKVYIDGKESRIYNSDYILQGVYIPMGEHTIEFRFEPISFKIGVCLLFIGIFLLIIMMVYLRHLKKVSKGTLQ